MGAQHRARQLCPGSGEGQRSESTREDRGFEWSERGVQSTEVRCRVLAPMMPLRLRRETFLNVHGILIGLRPVRLELDAGLTPLPRYELKKRSKSKAFWRTSMK